MTSVQVPHANTASSSHSEFRKWAEWGACRAPLPLPRGAVAHTAASHNRGHVLARRVDFRGVEEIDAVVVGQGHKLLCHLKRENRGWLQVALRGQHGRGVVPPVLGLPQCPSAAGQAEGQQLSNGPAEKKGEKEDGREEGQPVRWGGVSRGDSGLDGVFSSSCRPRASECDLIWTRGLCRCHWLNYSEMRSHCIWVGPTSSMRGVLIRTGTDTLLHGKEEHWGDAPPSQEHQRPAGLGGSLGGITAPRTS